MTRLLGNSLPQTIAKMQKLQTRESVSPTIFVGDWYEYYEPMEYVDSENMAVINTEVDLTKVFAVGNPLRYKQGGAYKYGWVSKVETSQIRVSAGDDYSVLNADITDVAKGLGANATGFPFVFAHDPNFRNVINHISQKQNEVYRFWMNGPICYIDYHFESADLSSFDSSIIGDLPVPYQPSADTPIYINFGVNDFSPVTVLTKIGSGVGIDLEIQVLTDAGFGSWTSTTNGLGLDITLGYLVEI